MSSSDLPSLLGYFLPDATYGKDWRFNIATLSEYGYPREFVAEVEKQANSVAAFIKKENLLWNKEDNYYYLNPKVLTLNQSFKKDLNASLISVASFREERRAAHGTAFLVKDNAILTVAHNIFPNSIYPYPDPSSIKKHLESFFVVFAFNQEAHIPKENVFEIQKVISYKHQIKIEDFHDWALLKLNRKAKGFNPLELDLEYSLSNNCPLYMIGHSMGLVSKFTAKGCVKENKHPMHFESNLNAFGGSSGSPIFDEKTQQLVGFLSRGNEKYKKIENFQGKEVIITEPHDQKKLKHFEICQRVSSLLCVKSYLDAHQKDAEAEAQEELALFYTMGHFCSQDLSLPKKKDSLNKKELFTKNSSCHEKKAYKWFQRAAEQGRILSIFHMGTYHFLGEIVERDLSLAKQYFTRLVRENFPAACYQLGLIYEEQQMYHFAFRYFYRAALNGDMFSQHKIALYYLDGKSGIEKNTERGLQWLKLAGKNGNARALYHLGSLYKGTGNRIPKDLGLAFKYFEQATERLNKEYSDFQFTSDAEKLQGSAIEQLYVKCHLMMGILYSEGIGTIVNYEKALEHFKKAADAGNTKALFLSAMICKKIKKNEEFFSHLEDCVSKKQDHPIYNFHLSLCYLLGNGTSKDENLAAQYARKSFNQGLSQEHFTNILNQDLTKDEKDYVIQKLKQLIYKSGMCEIL